MKKVQLQTELFCRDGSVEILRDAMFKRIPVAGDNVEDLSGDFSKIEGVFFHCDGTVTATVERFHFAQSTLREGIEFAIQSGWKIWLHENNHNYLKRMDINCDLFEESGIYRDYDHSEEAAT